MSRYARRAIRLANTGIDTALLICLIGMALYGIYSLWDTSAVYAQADAANYRVFRPDGAERTPSWEDLLTINPDTVGWLQIYGTNIDYPLVQTDNNEKYLSTSPVGEYSLSGSLFLDWRCARDFSDAATVVYGHHMDKDTMFGGLDHFTDEAYFEQHRYGDVFFSDAHHGLEIVGVVRVPDAYNTPFYTMPVATGALEPYVAQLKQAAERWRDTPVSASDRLLVLSTCSTDSTNGRLLVVGRISDEVFENTFGEERYEGTGLENTATDLLAWMQDHWWWLPIALAAAGTLAWGCHRLRKRRRARLAPRGAKVNRAHQQDTAGPDSAQESMRGTNR